MKAMTRAQFLRGNWDGSEPMLRPPWALAAVAFKETCTDCGDCLGACPENILVRNPGGFPQIDFKQGACTFCGECVTSCKTGALVRDIFQSSHPWSVQAHISEQCLAHRGTSCVTCIETCEHDAIHAQPALGGRCEMRIELESCTGCGGCFAVCPVNAISLAESGGSIQ